MSKLVRKSSVDGSAVAMLNAGLTSTGFLPLLHLLVADFLRPGETCAGGEASALNASSFVVRGSGTFFLLRNLFIVILKRLVPVLLWRKGGLEGFAIPRAGRVIDMTY